MEREEHFVYLLSWQHLRQDEGALLLTAADLLLANGTDLLLTMSCSESCQPLLVHCIFPYLPVLTHPTRSVVLSLRMDLYLRRTGSLSLRPLLIRRYFQSAAKILPLI